MASYTWPSSGGGGVSGVSSLNSLTGDLNGTGITITPSGTNITITATGAGSGTVTSVALTTPSFLSVSGSPITTAGTLAVSLATQSANLVFAGPATGAAAAPTFRSLVSADIPSLNYVSSVTGTAPIVSSGGLTPAISITTGNLSDSTGGSDGITVTGGTGVLVGTSASIAQQVANNSQNGYLSAANFTAFSTKISSISVTSPLLTTGGLTPTLSIQVANSTQNGYLDSTDWNTFNNKGSVSSVTFTGDGTVLSSTPSSPVTTTGTLTATLNTQTANTILAGPASGSAASPTFRALVRADLPASVAVTAPIQNPSGALTSSYTPVLFGSISSDTNNAYDTLTGVYTVPVAGWYTMYVQLEIASTVYSVNDNVQVAIFVNSTDMAAGGLLAPAGVNSVVVKASYAAPFALNDQIVFMSFFTSAGSGSYVSNAAGSNFWIVRTGN
jgi:hypothetical protein